MGINCFERAKNNLQREETVVKVARFFSRRLVPATVPFREIFFLKSVYILYSTKSTDIVGSFAFQHISGAYQILDSNKIVAMMATPVRVVYLQGGRPHTPLKTHLLYMLYKHIQREHSGFLVHFVARFGL